MEQISQGLEAFWSLVLAGRDVLFGWVLAILNVTTADHLEGAAVMAAVLLGPSLALGLIGGFWEGLRIEWRQLRGRARAIDGDTLEVRGERIRLFGIDTPELGQPWWDEDGHEQDAGEVARGVLAELIEGRRLSVKVLREDKYERSLAIVNVDGRDIARSMVRQGWAFASPGSARYRRTQNAARRRRRGFWQGEVLMPWEFRAAA